MYAIVHLVVLTVTILALARLVPGFRIRSPGTAIVVAIVFSVLNVGLGWFIQAVLFVPALLTLGLLFLFLPLIVNAVVLWVTDKLMASFEMRDGRTLFVSALAITVVNFLFQMLEANSALQAHGYAPGHWI